jgi:sodium transport system ATP-binding protein
MGPVLKIENLSKAFGKHQALHAINLEIAAGQIFGLLGPNGAGKTTLLRVVATLLKPDTGSVTLAQMDTQMQPLQVRQMLGVVNAGMGLYERLTGRENLRFFGRISGMPRIKIDQQIEKRAQELGIESWIDARSGTYSTGMRQKVLIARAVLHDPKVLILDEASNGLDVYARRGLLNFARSFAELGGLVIYSTHVLSEAQALCHHAAIIHEGKLLAHDSVPALIARTNTSSLEDAFFALAKHKLAA